MPSPESHNHTRLKALTLAWAQTNGFALAGLEVRVPKSGYRADVAAYAPLRRDQAANVGGWSEGRTAIFECKQSRTDLLKDAHAEHATRARLAALMARRRNLEELLAVHRPDLRRGEALWPEYDAWDFSSLEHRAYRGVLTEIDTVQRRVVRGTKFSKMFRYRCADYLYLVVEDGIFAEAEIPAGWGLLVRQSCDVVEPPPGSALGPERVEGLRLARPPANLDATPAQRAALLECIAAAGTRAVNRAAGVVLPRPDWTSVDLPKS